MEISKPEALQLLSKWQSESSSLSIFFSTFISTTAPVNEPEPIASLSGAPWTIKELTPEKVTFSFIQSTPHSTFEGFLKSALTFDYRDARAIPEEMPTFRALLAGKTEGLLTVFFTHSILTVAEQKEP